ncbi:MAG: RDD family protein [Dokdonella sp.]|jgi:uncharacterized RDD family membrane protein YckC|uniref:RDD family protein n=1 Tax=Dokdonella sp. TaxID=2291710 RepID=UPI001B68E312|nr:RDD family protein [Dokdonella sp.]HQV48140.1 RDD family protein [Dokdonella sp.]HQX33291.1 RDD family protein [Dokdonella sp.]
MLPRAAPFWRRIAALIYDLLVLMAIWMVTAALILLAFQGEVDVARQPPLYHVLLQAALFVVTALYFVVSWRKGGQTIGMRAWRVRIVDANGHSPDFPRALLRFVCALLSLLLLGAGFIYCLFDGERRAWHDVMAKTRMVV